jgi:membrane-bound serine protease (ClpP class)
VQLDSENLDTARVIGEGRGRRRQPNQEVAFTGLGLIGQLQHTMISPSIAYFLFVAGLALAVFEFFAASVGFAAAVGALSILGGMYGFSHLPVRWWAVALLVVATGGFAISAQAGGSRFWTVTGVVTLVGGAIALYGGEDLRPAWWVIATVVLGAILFYRLAVPSFIRARFSTPTVGREGMIGEMGTAEVEIDPDGVLVINGARWRARTNRATPIAAGAAARVVSVDGLVLEVEPETGGARDYRDRSPRKRRGEPTD